jgi:CheY-like chemotaxis protein
MHNFNFFSRPYNIVCVDDDASFLELLAMASPDEWHLILYTLTQDMRDHLSAQTILAQHDFSLFNDALENKQSSKESRIVKVLQYWRQNPQRWAQTEVTLIDYAMPRMTGLKLLTELPRWSGINILLTGVADEIIAVKAFNEGLIQQFIPKQSNNIVEELVNTLQRVRSQLFKPYQLLCEAALTADQLMLLRAEKTQQALYQFAAQHWVEYVVLPDPFGVLGISKSGQLSWLQIERACDIDDLKAIAATETWDALSQSKIQAGTALSNSLLRQALKNSIAPALASVMPLGDSGTVAAHFEFQAPSEYAASCSYAEWFKVNDNRLIKKLLAQSNGDENNY